MKDALEVQRCSLSEIYKIYKGHRPALQPKRKPTIHRGTFFLFGQKSFVKGNELQKDPGAKAGILGFSRPAGIGRPHDDGQGIVYRMTIE